MSNNTQGTDRIAILDGFRFTAILSVMLYHYFSLWTAPLHTFSLYPYGSKFNYFGLGFLGVQLFFIISGFVIASSLEASSSISAFLKKRMIRLFPAMLICSLITLLFCCLLDFDDLFPRSRSFKNLLYSVTFIHPELINLILRPFHIHGTTLCGSYWSLWPEVQFYFLAAGLYFLSSSKFFKHFLFVTLGIYLVNKLLFLLEVSNYVKLAYLFNLVSFIPWFAIGVLFYQVYSGKKDKMTIPGIILLSVLLLYECSSLKMGLLVALILLAFVIFIYRPVYLSFFKNKALATVGLSSYALYLLHEHIGVILIHNYAAAWGDLSFLFPLFLIIGLMIFCILFYRFLEQPITAYLKSKLVKKEN